MIGWRRSPPTWPRPRPRPRRQVARLPRCAGRRRQPIRRWKRPVPQRSRRATTRPQRAPRSKARRRRLGPEPSAFPRSTSKSGPGADARPARRRSARPWSNGSARLTGRSPRFGLRPATIAAETETLGGKISASAQHCRRSRPSGWRAAKAVCAEAIENSRLADQALAEARERRARLEVQSDGGPKRSRPCPRHPRAARRRPGGARRSRRPGRASAAPAQAERVEARLANARRASATASGRSTWWPKARPRRSARGSRPSNASAPI